jgi:hypothetical protein
MLFFMGNDFVGAIFGPPAIWNRTRHTPPRTEILGAYSESERHLDQENFSPPASLVLNADGSMKVLNLPFEFWPNHCVVSGHGKWKGPDADEMIELEVVSDGTSGNCKSGSYSSLELTGNSQPYRLYWVVGDPDSGTGIWLKKS